MEQLPLEVRLADFAVLDTYFPGPNGALVHALRDVAHVRSRSVIWVWGPPGTGKSHLLQATVQAGDAAGCRAAYLPLADLRGGESGVLDGMGALDLVCLDDIHTVAGLGSWEASLLRLFEELRQGGARLVMAADRAPLHTRFHLPDLVSRFTSGATFRLQPLTDEEKLKALQRRAQWRGLDLPDDTARYLMTRVQRDAGNLFALLDRLDREALAARRRLTVPFVKAILARGDPRSPNGVQSREEHQ